MNCRGIVLITGAGGFLGRHLTAALDAEGYSYLTFKHSELDVTDSDAVEKAIETYHPDILVHCAAISSTTYAAEHPQESMKLNVMAPLAIAGICGQKKIQFFAMSSDQVYGGCQTTEPLNENTPLDTNNIYGQHKLLMEEKVLEANPDAVVLRLSWMFEDFNKNNPHTDIISKLMLATEPIKASTREYRGISHVDTVCQNIIRSFGVLPGGVYNFGSTNLLTSYDTLQAIASIAGKGPDFIIPDNSWGRNLSMDCEKLKRFGISFPDTVQAISSAFIKKPIQL